MVFFTISSSTWAHFCFFASRTQAQENIEHFDEKQLKILLDEAMNYKSPRDANDKSATFKVSRMITSFMDLWLIKVSLLAIT